MTSPCPIAAIFAAKDGRETSSKGKCHDDDFCDDWFDQRIHSRNRRLFGWQGLLHDHVRIRLGRRTRRPSGAPGNFRSSSTPGWQFHRSGGRPRPDRLTATGTKTTFEAPRHTRRFCCTAYPALRTATWDCRWFSCMLAIHQHRHYGPVGLFDQPSRKRNPR